ncbi:MAG TPA: hypothetical protein VFU37_06440 [Pyrinomonadaceae bacterium]|nr:hypothetical protein [Pyrinomonadaceae bacterium]
MKKVIVTICALLLLTTTAASQTRKRTTKKSTSSATTTAAEAEAAAAKAARTEGATKVANQIKNLTTFLYLLGGVARSIEALDAAAKTEPSPTNEKNKAQLRQSFSDFRVGLDALEVYFRNTPALQPYYTKLVGSASGAATAEAQATAGQFNQAGRTLIGVVGRLADVLVVMR